MRGGIIPFQTNANYGTLSIDLGITTFFSDHLGSYQINWVYLRPCSVHGFANIILTCWFIALILFVRYEFFIQNNRSWIKLRMIKTKLTNNDIPFLKINTFFYNLLFCRKLINLDFKNRFQPKRTFQWIANCISIFLSLLIWSFRNKPKNFTSNKIKII